MPIPVPLTVFVVTGTVKVKVSVIVYKPCSAIEFLDCYSSTYSRDERERERRGEQIMAIKFPYNTLSTDCAKDIIRIA